MRWPSAAEWRRGLGGSTAVWLGLTSPSAAQSSAGGSQSLAGLWGAELSFGPAVRGLLTVARRGGRWTAQVGSLAADAAITGDSIHLVFPGGQGELRAQLRKRGGAIEGQWIQAPGLVTGVRYTSPLRLPMVTKDVWQGTIDPLDDRYSLYLHLDRDSTGSWTGVFRNPERNDRGGSPRFRIERSADTLRFVDPSGGVRITATIDSSRQITLPWMPLGLTLTLQPRSAEDAIGFFPRTPPGQHYDYQVPLAAGDGWTVARASLEGVDEGLLAELVRRVAGVDPSQPTAPLVHSVLIAHHGRLVLDEYFFGYDRERPHDTRSASKTFASVMVGAAIAKGASLDPNAPVAPYFARYAPFSNPDPRKDRITLAHLMAMTSGLACDENDSASPGNEGTMQSQTAQPDWYKFTLDLPMARDPGAEYAYCSASANLIGGVVAAATRTWLPALFDTLIARPLDMRHYYTNLTPTGDMYFGGGIHMRPRDLLKLGQVYLDGGLWQGRRIVTADWIRRSIAPSPPLKGEKADGFNWHLNELQVGDRSYREYEANGNGGQFLIVLPELDAAVVFTAGNYGSYPVWRKFRDELVPQFVIPAILRKG